MINKIRKLFSALANISYLANAMFNEHETYQNRGHSKRKRKLNKKSQYILSPYMTVFLFKWHVLSTVINKYISIQYYAHLIHLKALKNQIIFLIFH